MKLREEHFGVPPENLHNRKDYVTVYKSAKKGQTSFRVSKILLDNLWQQAQKLVKKPQLILSIGEYTISCTIQKQTM